MLQLTAGKTRGDYILFGMGNFVIFCKEGPGIRVSLLAGLIKKHF
jgi:hypothetical protein